MILRLLFITIAFLPFQEKHENELSASNQTRFEQSGQIILFTQEGDKISPEEIKNINILAEETGLNFIKKDISEGAPEEITLTPSIVFQNHLGRSVFKGRYLNLPRLKNFIRTARRIPQKKAITNRQNTLTWESEKAKFVMPVKITELTGDLPESFDQDAFKEKAKTAFSKEMKRFTIKKEVSLKSNARLFYVALYPYQDQAGNFSLSAEIYSQFNCIEPVFLKFDDPFKSKSKKWEKAFCEAGTFIEKEIQNQIKHSSLGDACKPVSSSAPVDSWETIGLVLPNPPANNQNDTFDPNKPVDKNWVYDQNDNLNTPFLQFNFLAPVDNYAGEVTDMNGRLELSSDLSLEKAIGQFTVKTATVTMGDPALDNAIWSKMIEVVKFPSSSFSFSGASGTGKTLSFGEAEQIEVFGDFRMIGITIPVKVQAQIEPILDDLGNPRLQVEASFKLALKNHFGIEGPDGPAPASETLEFYLNFLMRPA